MLFAVFSVSVVAALALAIYSLGTLIGSWDRPKPMPHVAIPKRPPPRVARPVRAQAPPPSVVVAMAPPPVAPAPVAPPPVPSFAAQPITLPRATPPPQRSRLASGSIPPPIPSARPLVMPRDDFESEDATTPEDPRFSIVRSSRRA